MKVQKHADPNQKITEREMSKMLITTVLSMLICLFSLVGLTWAWFSEDVVSQSVTVTAAYFTVEVRTSADGSSYSDPVSGTNKEYMLPAGITKIKLTSGGNATKGFFLIEAGGNKYYTAEVNKCGAVEIQVSNLPEAGAKIKIIPAWGGIPNGYNEITDGTVSFPSLSSLRPNMSAPINTPAPQPEEEIPEEEEIIEDEYYEEEYYEEEEEYYEEEITEEPEEIPEPPTEETPKEETPTEEAPAESPEEVAE